CGNVTASCTNTTVGAGQTCGSFDCCGTDGALSTATKSCDSGFSCTNAVCVANCGNEVLDAGEECDFGDNNSDTGACTSECNKAVCGDGKIRAGFETCDGGDNCDANSCQCDTGYSAVEGENECEEACGNEVLDAGEECDLGNGVNSNTGACTLSCLDAACGDSFIQGEEECDDGANGDDTDGCNDSCIEIPLPSSSVASSAVASSVVSSAVASSVVSSEVPSSAVASSVVSSEVPSSAVASSVVSSAVASSQEIIGGNDIVTNDCGNGIIEFGEDCDFGSESTAVCDVPQESCNTVTCQCAFTDINLCGNDPDICCIEGASRYCCQQNGSSTENTGTICWQTGENPPPTACEAVDPAFECSSCNTNAECRNGEMCFEGTCSLFFYSDTWVATEDFPVFAKAVDHSIVTIDSVVGKRFWDIFQEVGAVFSNSNIASGTGPGWVSESGDFPGTPSIGEFTHLVFNDKQWLIGGSDYGRAPRRTRDVWSSIDGAIWQQHINALPMAIDRHTSVVFNNKMWIFGGAQGSNDIGDAILVSPDGTSWTEAGNLPEGLIYAESLVYNDAILIIGGETDNGVSLKVWSSTGGIIWEEVGDNALDGLSFAKRPATVFGGRIWIVGRSTDDQPLTYYSQDGGETWEDGPDPETHVFGGTDLSALDNKLWLIGSYDETTSNHAGNVHYLAAVPRDTCNPTEFDNPYYCEEESSSSQSSSSALSISSLETTSSVTSSITNSTATSVASSVISFALPIPIPPTTTTNNPSNPGEGPNRIVCGDGRTNGREQCDDGNNRNRDGCSSSCELESLRSNPTPTFQPIPVNREPRCGNGLVEANEDCDDANTRNGDGCSSSCRAEPRLVVPADSVCGNGITEDTEACDLGSGNSDTTPNACRNNCQLPRCGDFVFDEGEACDNGPANSDTKPNACRTSCTLPACGDGTIDADETCDDGNLNDGDGCSATCQVQDVLLAAARVCGDGILASPEECDDGNKRDDDGCSSSCLLESGLCGDGIIQSLAGEECENLLHDKNLPFQCIDCLFASYTCGDGVVDAGEECDNGSLNSNTPDALCRPLCHLARCGDGIIDNQEECDDGNYINTDNCDAQCRDRSAVLGTSTTVKKPTDTPATPSVKPAAQVPPSQISNPSQMFFPTMPTGKPLPYQLPLAQLQPLIQAQGPIGDTGPAAVAVVASGMAAGIGWMRRKRKQ
ncbi:hypothetical protein COU76_01610, partial [Candidatus Peregrinibacteria bacterium CG10_big_fil_rev_8_21_14_0_10_49_10]